jgi:hypothetical protein
MRLVVVLANHVLEQILGLIHKELYELGLISSRHSITKPWMLDKCRAVQCSAVVIVLVQWHQVVIGMHIAIDLRVPPVSVTYVE